MEITDLQNILNNLNSDYYTYGININSGTTFSISSGSTLIGNVNIDPNTDLNSLTKEKLPEPPQLPEPTIEEIILNDIRNQEDYTEESFYYGNEFNCLLNYKIESSATLGKSIKMTWLYTEDGRGIGSKIEII